MRKQNVGNIFSYQRFHTDKRGYAAAAGVALALIIHADEIERRAIEWNQHVFMAKEFHAELCEQFLRAVFGLGINFMIAVATVNTERG